MRAQAYLLASDLDGTLIPPSDPSADTGIADLRSALERSPGTLAYVTGRHLRLAQRGIELHSLPVPDILVCDVGTSVFFRRGDTFVPDPEYADVMRAALGGLDPAALRRSLEGLEGLRLQEPEKQAEFKISYYTVSGAAGEVVAQRVKEVVREAGGSVNVVFSVDPAENTGLIDILPATIAKDTAVRYLHDHSGVPEARLVYAGDSGNDRAAMLSGFNVVVVGNASKPFKRSIEREADRTGLGPKVYLARGAYARGVLEGCRHFGIL